MAVVLEERSRMDMSLSTRKRSVPFVEAD